MGPGWLLPCSNNKGIASGEIYDVVVTRLVWKFLFPDKRTRNSEQLQELTQLSDRAETGVVQVSVATAHELPF